MSVGSVLKQIVPTLATVLGGPMAGLAVEAIGNALGMTDATKDKIEDALRGPLTGEQIVALKTAERALIVRMRELDLQVDQLEVQDRSNAREREIKVGSMMTSILGIGIVAAMIAMAFSVIFVGQEIESALAGSIIGYLVGLTQQVFAYYFGSSRGSADKSAAMEKMTADVVSISKSSGTGTGDGKG